MDPFLLLASRMGPPPERRLGRLPHCQNRTDSQRLHFLRRDRPQLAFREPGTRQMDQGWGLARFRQPVGRLVLDWGAARQDWVEDDWGGRGACPGAGCVAAGWVGFAFGCPGICRMVAHLGHLILTAVAWGCTFSSVAHFGHLTVGMWHSPLANPAT